MARFDVHPHAGDGYLLDCQADLLSHFDTRLVVPLLPARGAKKASRLHPVFDVGGEEMIMVTHLASSVAVRHLQKPVASLGDHQESIVGALDMLITGF